MPVGKLATEGKGSPPKTPVGTDAPDTEANEKDFDKPTEMAKVTVFIPGGTNSEDTKVFERPKTEICSKEESDTLATYDD